MDFKFVEKLPTAAEYNFLRESVGWGIYDINVINNSLINSLYCIIVYKNEQLIGMGKIIGDKGLCFYIQDVIVLPEFQKMGVGNKIMTKIMEYISNNANNKSIIGLITKKSTT